MQNSREDTLRSLYTTVFSLKFSPNGNLLAASDNFGCISLFRLSSVLSAENVDKPKYPYLKLKVNGSSLYALENTDDFLISSPLNQINGWKWSDLSKSKNYEKPFFSIKLPLKSSSSLFESDIETNTLAYDSKIHNNRIFAGCGNGEIYCVDFETGKLIHKYEAHNDCIYQILIKNNKNELVSVSEDGSVKTWDLRSKNNVMTIKPYENQICSRPHLGRHINCVSVDEDNWLICGGGPRLAMWHMRSMRPMCVPEFNDDFFMPNVCKVHDNQIITGGNTNRLFYHTFENKLKTEIVTNTNCIFDICINYSTKSNQILTVCGSGTSIDLCSNFSYKALTLTL